MNSIPTQERDGRHLAGADEAMLLSAPTKQDEELIEELDLAQVRMLALATYRDWKPQTAVQAEREYRDFLWVCRFWASQNGHRLAGLSVRADQMWHCHMLLPRKYSRDCDSIFGRGNILDHDPFFSHRSMPRAISEARKAYRAAGREFPTDLSAVCVWAVVDSRA